MTVLEFIDILQPYHGYLGLALNPKGSIEHPRDAEGVPFPTTWAVLDDDEMTKVAAQCQRCHYLAIAGLHPVE